MMTRSWATPTGKRDLKDEWPASRPILVLTEPGKEGLVPKRSKEETGPTQGVRASVPGSKA